MKLNAAILSLALAGFATLSSAQPHGKQIRNLHNQHRRAAVTNYITKYVDQNGNAIPAPTAAPTPTAHSPRSVQEIEVVEEVDSEYIALAEDLAADSPKLKRVIESTVFANVSGVDEDFPDGELPCSHFPSNYGALAVEWVTPSGWSGLQWMEKQASGEIRLATADHVGKCSEGFWCSFACPPGYSKAQWPEEQPENGESIGGLKCENGKLRLTRPKKSKKLCIAGADSTTLVNKLSKGVSICRTDYPGTENMCVPIFVGGGGTEQMTVPKAVDSYKWQGKATSAQYYVNNAGLSPEEGCIWGKPDGGIGNWAPMVFGAGVDENGATYLSLFQNPLTTEKLNFNVLIDVGDESQSCKYEDGKFYGPGTMDGSKTGCTCAPSGAARFVFY